jgi:hypothetical protein
VRLSCTAPTQSARWKVKTRFERNRRWFGVLPTNLCGGQRGPWYISRTTLRRRLGRFDFAGLKEVGPSLRVHAFDEAALGRAVTENALHPITIEAENRRAAEPNGIGRSDRHEETERRLIARTVQTCGLRIRKAARRNSTISIIDIHTRIGRARWRSLSMGCAPTRR